MAALVFALPATPYLQRKPTGEQTMSDEAQHPMELTVVENLASFVSFVCPTSANRLEHAKIVWKADQRGAALPS
jgi:hypothetical protein